MMRRTAMNVSNSEHGTALSPLFHVSRKENLHQKSGVLLLVAVGCCRPSPFFFLLSSLE